MPPKIIIIHSSIDGLGYLRIQLRCRPVSLYLEMGPRTNWVSKSRLLDISSIGQKIYKAPKLDINVIQLPSIALKLIKQKLSVTVGESRSQNPKPLVTYASKLLPQGRGLFFTLNITALGKPYRCNEVVPLSFDSIGR